MKLRKILLGLTLAGSLISHQAFALTPAEEVAQAKAAATARADAARAAILAEQARQMLIVYGPAPTVTTPTPATTPVVTAPPPTGPGINLSPYTTAEYTANGISAGNSSDDYLRVVNASSAWSRGYTGLGSKILIIDSGINAKHSEFLNSITDTKDFVRSKFGINDNVGHGTRMASIAAANWDGVGVAGVAPDAMLAIAKVTDNTSYGFSQARQAIA
jgi:subtilisin family serine protease